VVLPASFGERLAAGEPAEIQVLTDGTQPNTANFVAGYAEGVLGNWLGSRGGSVAPLRLEERIWFNPEIESRRFLLPGALAIVMTMIGTLLTALVVAREWERGTMEALMSTPAGTLEILVGKLLPYFALGLLATVVCTLLTIHVFGVPLRGSWATLLCLTAAFLVPALGQGLLISAVTRNQFVASQLALLSSFLPAFLLSGFLFQIEAMPRWIQLLTHVIPARYFVSSLQTVFLAGDVWEIFRADILSLLALGTFFFGLTILNLRRGLEP
jgi:ABC-2 type transport system permease protein